MKVNQNEKAEALTSGATIGVRWRAPLYYLENLNTGAVIAEGFKTRGAAESYARVMRQQQQVLAEKSS